MQHLAHNAFTITSLNLFLTDPQANQFRHSFVVASEFSEDTIDDILRATNGGVNTSTSSFSNVVGDVMSYEGGVDNFNQGGATIDHGWQEPRIRWQLRAMLKQLNRTEEYILSGWTDHDGVHDKGTNGLSLDENMILHVNTIQVVTHKSARTHGVMTSNEQVMINTDQHRNDISMRPSDNLSRINVADVIASSTQSGNYGSSLRNHHNIDTILKGDGINLSVPTVKDMNTEMQASRRTNNNAVQYVQSQVKAVSDAQVARRTGSERSDLNMIDNDDVSVFHTCESSLRALEHSVKENILISEIGKVSDILRSGSFTIRQLGEIDKENSLQRQNVVTYRKPSYGAITCESIATGDWKSSNLKTSMAAIVRDSLPSIMINANITHARMVFTNLNLAGIDELAAMPIDTGKGDGSLSGRSVPMLTSYENVDMLAAWDYMHKQFLLEIAPLLTKRGQIAVELDIEMNISGNLIVGVLLGDSNSNEFDVYTAPMYADRLTSPIVTDSINNANTMALAINNIASSITTQKVELLDRHGSIGRSGRTGDFIL